ncbi:MAG: DMT family transporter [Desulfosarcinaceae bacterium]
MPPIHNRQQVKLDAGVAGPLFMLAAALLFTVLNLLIKLLGPEYTVWHIGFYRFCGGILVLVLVFGRRSNPYRGHNTRLLIIRGCTGSAAFLSIITAIRLLPISTALVIFYAFPAFSAIFSYLFSGERISKAEIACIANVILGIGILFDFRLGGHLFGQIMALSAAAFAGLTVTLIKTLRNNNGPVIIYLYFCTMGMLITLPRFALDPLVPASSMEWGMILGIIFASITAQLLMNQGFFYCKGWEGGVFMSSEVVFTAIVGIAFLDDPASWRFWLGGLLIFGSAVALNRFKASRAKKEIGSKSMDAEATHA